MYIQALQWWLLNKSVFLGYWVLRTCLLSTLTYNMIHLLHCLTNPKLYFSAWLFLHSKNTLSLQSEFRITIPFKKSCNIFVSWYFSIIYCTVDLVNENYLAASPKLIPELQVFILHGFKSRQIFSMLLMSSLKWTMHVLITGNLMSSKTLQISDTA